MIYLTFDVFVDGWAVIVVFILCIVVIDGFYVLVSMGCSCCLDLDFCFYCVLVYCLVVLFCVCLLVVFVGCLDGMLCYCRLDTVVLWWVLCGFVLGILPVCLLLIVRRECFCGFRFVGLLGLRLCSSGCYCC